MHPQFLIGQEMCAVTTRPGRRPGGSDDSVVGPGAKQGDCLGAMAGTASGVKLKSPNLDFFHAIAANCGCTPQLEWSEPFTCGRAEPALYVSIGSQQGSRYSPAFECRHRRVRPPWLGLLPFSTVAHFAWDPQMSVLRPSLVSHGLATRASLYVV